MLNQTGKARERRCSPRSARSCRTNDLVAVSFYPFIRGGTTDIDGCLQVADRRTSTRTRSPTRSWKSGRPPSGFELPKSGQVIDGTPEKQAAYFEALLAFANGPRDRFVICFVHRDYDALWEKIKGTAPEAFAAWRDCGLVDEAGKPRAAFALWKNYLQMPLTPAQAK